MLDLTKISKTPVTKIPYEYMVINEVIEERDLDKIIDDYKNILIITFLHVFQNDSFSSVFKIYIKVL